MFNEKFKSDYVNSPGKGSQFFFYTLPIVDSHRWSSTTEYAGLGFMNMAYNGNGRTLQMLNPKVIEKGHDKLLILGDIDGHAFSILLKEDKVVISCADKSNDFDWYIDLWTPDNSVLPFTDILSDKIKAVFMGFEYELDLVSGKTKKTDKGFSIFPINNTIIINCTN